MAKDKLLGIHWVAKSYLADVELLSREQEHAYFRVLQYIYLTQDQLRDDDQILTRLTKCKSVREWQAIKAVLMEPRGIDPETGDEIPPRIWVEKGVIKNAKCTEKLADASRFRKQKTDAGNASAKKRKLLETNNTHSTAVSNGATNGAGNGKVNGDPNGGATNLKPLTSNHSSKKKDISEVVPISFQAWWAEYPRKVAKPPAVKAYDAALKRGATAEQLLDGVKRYAIERQGEEDKFTKFPATWLNADGWLDQTLDRNGQIVGPTETQDDRDRNFYFYWLKTGKWFDEDRKTPEDVPEHIRRACEAAWDREKIESAGQQTLAI